MASRITLKNFFKRGLKPTEGQFASLIDSTWNKTDDAIQITDVAGLNTTLGGKASISDLDAKADVSLVNTKQDALGFTPENAANKNTANGYAGLDGSGKVAASQLPSYVDDVVEYANHAALPVTGEAGKIYVTLDDNSEYRWSGSTYIQLVGSPGTTDAVVEGSINKYFTVARVLATVLTGISFVTVSAVVATDTILQAIGKLQAQVTALFKIPTGGTAGQLLAKVDGTDGNTHWIDAPSGGGGGGSGYTDRVFNAAIVFDAPFKSVYTQTADITLSLSGVPVADVQGRITIVGDGIHSLTFPIGWYNANGQTFDNTARNIIYFEFDGNEVLYSIVKVPTPDVTAPYLVSAIISNALPTKIVLTYSEPLDATSVPAIGDFSCNLSKAVTAVAVVGSQVTITVDSAYSFGDVPDISYTPGGNKIQDPSLNHAIALVTQAITNNVLPGSTSLSIVSGTQICKTSVIPVNLQFGSAGVDTPMSVSFWVKRSNTASEFIFAMGKAATNTGACAQLDSAGVLYFQIFNESTSSQAYISTNVGISSGVWTHICLTYNGSLLASGMKVYKNGTLAATTVGSASYPGQTTFSSGTALWVMGDNNGLGAAINVLLDSLYFWNKELTTGDVTVLYNAGALVDPTTLGITSNLQARYEFDSTLVDSVSGYDLTAATSPTYSTDHV